MNLKKIFDGYSNNPDYFGDWFGKGQIDFSSVINPEDEGDYWMVKLWSGSGYSLDVYIVKANDLYDAIDKVYEWSYNNEGANNIVMDYEYLSDQCKEWFKDEPDMFGTDLSDNYEEFEQRWFDSYIAGEMSGLYAREENFFVDKIPADIVEKYNVGKKTDSRKKRVKDSNSYTFELGIDLVDEFPESYEGVKELEDLIVPDGYFRGQGILKEGDVIVEQRSEFEALDSTYNGETVCFYSFSVWSNTSNVDKIRSVVSKYVKKYYDGRFDILIQDAEE